MIYKRLRWPLATDGVMRWLRLYAWPAAKISGCGNRRRDDESKRRLLFGNAPKHK